MEDRNDLIEHYFNLRYEHREILSCLQSVSAYQNHQSAIGNLDLSLCIDAFAVYALLYFRSVDEEELKAGPFSCCFSS